MRRKAPRSIKPGINGRTSTHHSPRSRQSSTTPTRQSAQTPLFSHHLRPRAAVQYRNPPNPHRCCHHQRSLGPPLAPSSTASWTKTGASKPPLSAKRHPQDMHLTPTLPPPRGNPSPPPATPSPHPPSPLPQRLKRKCYSPLRPPQQRQSRSRNQSEERRMRGTRRVIVRVMMSS